jgi:hypothetical protein
MNLTPKNKLRSTIIVLTILFLLAPLYDSNIVQADTIPSKEEVTKIIEDIVLNRNKAIINQDTELIQSVYDRSSKYGIWAYEYEINKMRYIHSWEEKQGVKFIEIVPKIVVGKLTGNSSRFSANIMCSTEYKYVYANDPNIVNTARIGTHHALSLIYKDGVWMITKEWYEDPFADSLSINSLKADSIKQYILLQSARDFSNMSNRRANAVDYAGRYCGAASDEQFGFKYNKKYRNYNSSGGDCANFASQILFEGGKFRKTLGWNYDGRGATRAWLNADGFKSYMIYSGRASLIAHGSYEKVYKASYKLLPGDFIAYEKKGDITHISVVTNADSKGYPLVTCHNIDRNNVPWDLGWSDKNIRFWLVHVNY